MAISSVVSMSPDENERKKQGGRGGLFPLPVPCRGRDAARIDAERRTSVIQGGQQYAKACWRDPYV